MKPVSVYDAAGCNQQPAPVEVIDMIGRNSPVHYHFINYETIGDDRIAALQHLMRCGAEMSLLSDRTAVAR